MKYSQEELSELAQGVFKDDKESPAIYADDQGTFRNAEQYGKLSAEERKKFKYSFKNPNVKVAVALDDDQESRINEIIEAADVEIKRLQGENSQKSEELEKVTTQLNQANSIIADRDSEIAKLKAGLEKYTATLPAAPADTKKKSGKTQN